MTTYKQVTLVLDQLYNLSLSAPSIPASPGVSAGQESLPIRPAEAEAEVC